MTEFIPDTEGVVLGLPFEDLHPFTQAYITAMLWTETSFFPMCEWHTEETQEAVREGSSDGPLPQDAGYSDIHPDTMIQIHTECSDFRRNNARWLSVAAARGYSDEQAGHDFWLTRNGHGAGFWDREVLDEDGLGRQLSDAAKECGERNAWFSEEEESESPTGYGYVYLE